MESSYSENKLLLSTFRQISDAISQILSWNEGTSSVDDYLSSSEGMKTLAATSMLIEAIGEGVKKIDLKTNGELLKLRPEIPWNEIKGIRNYLAHGYFDIDAYQILDVVENDLEPLSKAIQYFIEMLEADSE